jgi:hypothetical protein
MRTISLLVGLALATLLPGVAVAQHDEDERAPQYKQGGEPRRSTDIGKWVYFVSNDPNFAAFNVDGPAGEVRYTSPNSGGTYVVKSMKLKYIGDDGTGRYYLYQNDAAGGLIWALPKTKRGAVYWAYGGTATTEFHYYGPSVRFSPE